MTERPFESIKVQDILDRADVGRSTFYAHFEDKADLFMSDVDEFWSLMANVLVRTSERSERIAPIRELFEHAAGMSDFFAALRTSGKHHEVAELGRLHLARAIDARLARLPRTRHLTGARREGVAHAQSGAIMALLEWWVAQQNPMSAAEVDDRHHRSFWSGIEA